LFEHGGALLAAAKHYGIPAEKWLDVSTGINPHPWPAQAIERNLWQRLPQMDDALVQAAKKYYACENLVVVAGSQMAIRWLPRLRRQSVVGVPKIGYQEHAISWRQAGHQVQALAPQAIDAAVDELDVLVVINPNNPSGESYTTDCLLGWHERLRRRQGWLIVDEAFIDAETVQSMANRSHMQGIIVLRSFGKFFGLPGLRLGFVLCAAALSRKLTQAIGPWPVCSAARSVAVHAFDDVPWQLDMKQKLNREANRLSQFLQSVGLPPNSGTCLFQWIKTPQAAQWHEQLASQAVLTRYFASPESLRVGLPPPKQWPRLEQVFRQLQLA
jgi:cobalamin biosynthetic protein CobC